MIWYNSTTGKIRGREADDVIVDLGGGGSGGDSYTSATMEDFVEGLSEETSPATTDKLMLDVGTTVRKVTLARIQTLIGGSGGGSGYVAGDSPTFDDLIVTVSASIVGNVTVNNESNSNSSFWHRGRYLGFFNKATVEQEAWIDTTSNNVAAATKQLAFTNDSAEDLSHIINAIIRRLDALGLINLE